jgi:hypothetical protein
MAAEDRQQAGAVARQEIDASHASPVLQPAKASFQKPRGTRPGIQIGSIRANLVWEHIGVRPTAFLTKGINLSRYIGTSDADSARIAPSSNSRLF